MTTASQTMTEAIVEAILKCDRHASLGAMVSVSEVREAFDGFGFNVALWEAVRTQTVAIHKHDHPQGVSQAERDAMFTPDGKAFYNGVSIRQ